MRHGFWKRKRQASSTAHMPAFGMDMLEDFMGVHGAAEWTLPWLSFHLA